MKKNKFLYALLIALAISNGILLFVLFDNRPSIEGPKRSIIDMLDFDKNQIKAYEICIDQHRSAVIQSEAKMSEIRKVLYKRLNGNDPNLGLDTILSQIGKQQKAIEEINYNHFLAIKQLCRKDQLDEFENFVFEIPTLFEHQRRN